MRDQQIIQATYRVAAAATDIERIARFIAYEQTVELPEALVKDPWLLDNIVGQVLDIQALEEGFAVRIGYHAQLASGQLGQLVNLLYGNVSMLDGVRLADFELPPSVLAQFRGPLHGIDGLRRMLGVYQRPLLATAVKPRGTPTAELARLAGEFALGGGDIVKDDQNLVDTDFEQFKQRVDLIAKAVAAANAQTGRNCLYFPHLAARDQDLERYAEFVALLGLKGVLVCPQVLGLDRARALTQRYGLVSMAHPSMTGGYTQAGSHGISHPALLGKLFRLAGADISVFPAPGGRFRYSAEQCARMSDALRQPWGELASAFPCPAGGMRYDSLPGLSASYGADSVFLIGGSLLGHSNSVSDSTRTFRNGIEAHFQSRLEVPDLAATALPGSAGHPTLGGSDSHGEGVRTLLRFAADYNWEGRTDRAYKGGGDLPFAGVRRVELIGRNGELTDFDLRYFELEADGHTSLEKHVHTHVIIAIRGAGQISVGEQTHTLAPSDVVYVAPLEVHQLRNTGTEPFGFFCLVDRERDRPMRP